MLQLREDQIERLDAEAARLGRSRSRIVRDAVDESLAPRVDPAVAQRYAEAYASGTVADWIGDVDEWGSLEAWHEGAKLARSNDERDPW